MTELAIVEAGDYGSVIVVRGKYKGKVAYYDDDYGPRTAIVYFGVPFKDDSFILPRASLRKSPVASETLEHFVHQHPKLAALLGVPKR